MFWVTFLLLLNFLLFSGKHQTLFKGINYSLYFFGGKKKIKGVF